MTLNGRPEINPLSCLEFEESDSAKTNFASRDGADDIGFHSITIMSIDTLTLVCNYF